MEDLLSAGFKLHKPQNTCAVYALVYKGEIQYIG
jgi:hypothetical protein